MSSQKMDYSMHARACQTFFQQVQKVPNNTAGNPIQDSVRYIYLASSLALEKYITQENERLSNESQSTPSSPVFSDITCPEFSDETSVESGFSQNGIVRNNHNRNGVSNHLFEDLMLATTLACSCAMASPSQLKDKAGKDVSCRSVLISLAIHWAIASLLMPFKSDSKSELLRHVQHLMSTELIHSASTAIQGHICLFLSGSTALTMAANMPSVSVLYGQVRRALTGSMRNPLHFSVALALAAHSELAIVAGSPEDLAAFTTHASNVVQVVAKAAPRDGITDHEATGSTPVALVCSHRCPARLFPGTADIALALAGVLCHACPSALTIADAQGMYPLHRATRSGESSVVLFIVKNYSYTVPLRDASLRYPLNHAIENAASHCEAVILDLVRVYPLVLTDHRTLAQVAAFVQQANLSVALVQVLSALVMRHQQPAGYVSAVAPPRAKRTAKTPVPQQAPQLAQSQPVTADDSDAATMFSVVDSLLALHSAALLSKSTSNNNNNSSSVDGISVAESVLSGKRKISESVSASATGDAVKSFRKC